MQVFKQEPTGQFGLPRISLFASPPLPTTTEIVIPPGLPTTGKKKVPRDTKSAKRKGEKVESKRKKGKSKEFKEQAADFDIGFATFLEKRNPNQTTNSSTPPPRPADPSDPVVDPAGSAPAETARRTGPA